MAQNDNPLLQDWSTPFGVPPFDQFMPEHFQPALEEALGAHKAEIEAIASDGAAPTIANTLDAMERAGRLLSRVGAVFGNLSGADTSPELQAIEREMSPKFAKHSSEIWLDARLFHRFEQLLDAQDTLGLTAEQARVLERYHTGFVRAGARLDGDDKARVAEINQRLATLGTQFAQNMLADEADFKLVLEGEADLAGLPKFVVDAAAKTASDLDMAGKHVITLARSSIDPFLQFSQVRELRRRAFEAWTARGAKGGETDNRAIVAEILALRRERANLLGFETFAHYRLADAMAETPEAVRNLLTSVWDPALHRAVEERDDLQALARREGSNAAIAPWDWRYYAEKVRKERHNVSETEVKPYLQLDRMIEAAFDVAGRLFGLSFEARDDVPVYHADVRAWNVTGKDGRHVGVFLGDYFARPSKRSGAWMSTYRTQHKLDGEQRPIVVNVLNLVKGADDAPTLLSFDDARTLFHEFGHGLHGLLSDVTYPRISCTSVDRDFVELPSQLYEHWLLEPAVLRRFALHCETGEAMPEELLQRVLAARNFNQGFASVEYLSSAIVDLELHLMDPPAAGALDGVEADILSGIDMPAEITMRHRIPHFAHLFSGGGYASGYYSYLWSEQMDADAFAAFEETGDIFDTGMAKKLHDHIYSAGGRHKPRAAYTAFRGRLPTIDALLAKRGLAG